MISVPASELIELHHVKKMSIASIAAQLSMNPDRLSLYMRNVLGIEVIHYRPKAIDKLTDAIRKHIIDDYLRLLNIKAVMILHKISRPVVTSILNAAGVDIKFHKANNQSKKLSGRNKRSTNDYVTYCNSVGITLLGTYNGISKHTSHKCNECNNIWNASPGNVMHNKSGCPVCSSRENGRKRALSPDDYRKDCQTCVLI